MQKCASQPYEASYFTMNSNKYHESRQKTLFNLYAFGDVVFGNVSTPPTLVINQCDFKYFQNDYNSLINVETYQLINTVKRRTTNKI